MNWYLLLGIGLCVIGFVWHIVSPTWDSVEHTYRTNFSKTMEYMCVPIGFFFFYAPNMVVNSFSSLGIFFLYLTIGLIVDMVIRFVINKIKVKRKNRTKK